MMARTFFRRCAIGVAVALMALPLLPSAMAQSNTDALGSLRADREAAEASDQARLAALLEDHDALAAALDDARDNRDAVRERREELETRQAEQRERLDALSARRGEQGGDLSAVASVLDRHVGELRDTLGDSWLTLAGPALPERQAQDEILQPERIESVADTLMALTLETGHIRRFTTPVAGVDGAVEPREVIRLGDLAAFSGSDWLRRDTVDMPPGMVEHTPAEVASSLSSFSRGESERLVFDPSNGMLFEALAQRPSLVERFHQGGAIGYVIISLGVLGLLVALAQYGYLLLVTSRLHRQRRELDQLRDDNPLGRVLGKFHALRQGQAPEALEARLDEALLAEMPPLERGQPMTKLLAAVAPLLGLLGTVIGMILTFQSITVFGTGDPTMMAGGISMALVTTVQGLVTAIPLLFAHTALVSRSRYLIGVLEGAASTALAEHLEAQSSPVSHHESRHASALV